MKCDLCKEEGISINDGIYPLIKGKPSYFVCNKCLVENSTTNMEELKFKLDDTNGKI